MIGRALGRLILVPLGALLGALASLFVLATLGMERITAAFDMRDIDFDNIEPLFDMLKQTQLLASAITVIPALMLIVIGEVARIRSAIYYVLGGGLALASIPLMAQLGYSGAAFSPAGAAWQVFATAGFAGGLVYWMIAGRRA